ncbi:ABC-type multidrug transport system, ATPase and permease component [Bernardetia litoralis DSM 6794]|uniref:ABC-type multidrug transport system, ATPase and permease component n=2 Tax=Bernardetia litoralis TaxID=999 RepID=I4AM18_BERLS|nr:ABC-type multidrug transport system, ATPase and permease component [Bernardetia litoralis DSM 6794]
MRFENQTYYRFSKQTMKNTNEDINTNGSAKEQYQNAKPNLENTSENTTSTKKSEDKEDEHKKRKLNKESFHYLLGIYKFMMPYKGYFFTGMVCLFLSSIILLAFPELTGKLIDVATGKQSFLLDSINQIAFALVGIIIIQVVFSFLRVYLFAQVSEHSMADIRKELYQKYLSLPMSFYDKHRSGELMSRITADVALLQDTFSVTLAEFFRQIITLIVGLGILFYKTPKLTFFMLGVMPVLVIGAIIFGKFIRKLSKKTQDQLAESNIIVEETIQAIATVKAFTNEIFETNRYSTTQNSVIQTALKAATYRGAFVSFILFALFGSVIAVLWYGATLVSDGSLSIGDLTSFIIYSMFIGGSIGGLGSLYGQIQKGIGASERVLEILNEDSEPYNQTSSANQNPIEGNISFKNIGFSYPTRTDVEVLKGLSFDIKAGEKIALVGHSGAGKSTIIQLLERFYEPQNGTIEVDGKNNLDYDLNFYRSAIGIVPQEILLFGGTIKENIAYGKPNATEEEITQAAKKANAFKFIETFPEGLNTLVGERGVKLSGGQRQRIAIARAILRDPKILILDEATSSLDAESEHLVQEALDTLMKDRTTIIIAHRLATIRKVDTIYVMENGQISEQGTHESLVNQEGTYNQLVQLQLLDA